MNGAKNPIRLLGMPLSAIAFLVLTAAISLVVSHYRLLWFDEYLMLNTDSVHSLRQLIHVQRTAQLSLDPIAYHLFAYLAIRVFGLGTFALRLPSLLGFLLMQVCLFLFVRRIATERAALFAMIFPSVAVCAVLHGGWAAVWSAAGPVCAGAAVLAECGAAGEWAYGGADARLLSRLRSW